MSSGKIGHNASMDKLIHLDHIAIAVKSIKEARKLYEDIGFTFEKHEEVVESQKVKTAFAKVEGKAKIELLEATDSSSTIAKFINSKGEGIHHLSFRVDDIVKKQKELSDKGYIFIYTQAQPGADECMVNFIHPKSTGGILIELSQKGLA